MISRLDPTIMPVAPKPPERDRKPPGEDFGRLVNSNQSNEGTPSAWNGGSRPGAQPTDGRTGNGTSEHDEKLSTSDRRDASTVSANGLEAQSLLAPQTPSLPTVAPSKIDEMALSATMNSLAEAGAKMHVVAGASAERIEIVSLPWHLQANGGLSYSLTGTATQELLPEQTQHADAGTQSNSSTGDAVLAEGVGAGFAEEQSVYLQSGATSFVSDRVQRSTAMSTAADVAMPGRTAAATMQWPHRLLRWLADHDSRVTAWVRDYQLDATQASQLVDSLRSLAEQQGHSLHRIMLNGHELWRLPSTPDSH